MSNPAVAAPSWSHAIELTWNALSPQTLADNADIRTAWDRLNSERGNLPFLSACAISFALDVFGTGQERLFVGRQGDDVAGMFILVPQGSLRWRTFQPSQVPLGAWVARPEVGISALARSLIKAPTGGCLALSITQVDPRFAPREADRAWSEHRDYIDTGWIDIEGSFEEYWSARGKNLRQNMRKQRNKLAAEGTSTEMCVWTQCEDMSGAIARYGALEGSGWKAQEGTAVLADNDQGRFYRHLLEEAARAGEAVVYEYRFSGQTVAMNLCLQRDGTLVVLKTAYDESIKQYSPAFLLREEELQALFSEGGIKRLEYYGRLRDWHTKWTSDKRTLYHLTVYRWPWVKQLAQVLRRQPGGQAPQDNAAQEPGA